MRHKPPITPQCVYETCCSVIFFDFLVIFAKRTEVNHHKMPR